MTIGISRNQCRKGLARSETRVRETEAETRERPRVQYTQRHEVEGVREEGHRAVEVFCMIAKLMYC